MKVIVMEGEGQRDTRAAGYFWNPKYQAKESPQTGVGHQKTA